MITAKRSWLFIAVTLLASGALTDLARADRVQGFEVEIHPSFQPVMPARWAPFKARPRPKGLPNIC